VLDAKLRQPERIAHLVLHRLGKGQEVLLRRADPIERPFSLRQLETSKHLGERGMI
jgi:hypothetical protein